MNEPHPLLTKSAYGIRLYAPRYDLAELRKALAQLLSAESRCNGLWNKSKQTALEQAICRAERQAAKQIRREAGRLGFSQERNSAK